MGWHFPAGGLRRSAAGGPGRRQIPLAAWRLDAAHPARVTTCGGEQLSRERPVRVRHERPCLPDWGWRQCGRAAPGRASGACHRRRRPARQLAGSLIAGQAAAPPGAWAAVTPKPPPLPAAGAIQPSAACTQQPESSEWASAAVKSAGTDREADPICDRGRQCGRHGAYPAGPGGVRADAPGHFRPAAGGSSCRRSRRWHDGRILPGGSGQLPLDRGKGERQGRQA